MYCIGTVLIVIEWRIKSNTKNCTARSVFPIIFLQLTGHWGLFIDFLPSRSIQTWCHTTGRNSRLLCRYLELRVLYKCVFYSWAPYHSWPFFLSTYILLEACHIHCNYCMLGSLIMLVVSLIYFKFYNLQRMCTARLLGEDSNFFREYGMIYRGPGFLVIVWFGSSPTLLPPFPPRS